MVIVSLMKFVIHIPTLETWMDENNLRREDVASISGLSIGTVNKALSGEPISKGTLSALSLASTLTETELLGKEKPVHCATPTKKSEEQ